MSGDWAAMSLVSQMSSGLAKSRAAIASLLAVVLPADQVIVAGADSGEPLAVGDQRARPRFAFFAANGGRRLLPSRPSRRRVDPEPLRKGGKQIDGLHQILAADAAVHAGRSDESGVWTVSSANCSHSSDNSRRAPGRSFRGPP